MKTKHDILDVYDMWIAYVRQLLTANPDWSTGRNQNAALPHRKQYHVYRPYDKFDNKLKHKRVEVINFGIYRNVIETYFERAKVAIIDGERLKLGSNLGSIFPVCAERDHTKKRINFNETLKAPKVLTADGKIRREYIVYFTDDYWCSVYWRKLRRVTNEYYYLFSPTKSLKSRKGFTQMFSDAVKADPTLKDRYVHHPIKRNAT